MIKQLINNRFCISQQRKVINILRGYHICFREEITFIYLGLSLLSYPEKKARHCSLQTKKQCVNLYTLIK